jgi:hypothetical protein
VSAWPAQWATALAVLAVATIAAVVSYAHIQALALSHGYTPGTAGLLPFSVDGLIVASSLALANGARPSLARSGLVLGVLATVAANLAYGSRFGLAGEVISAWPAVAFLLASEILLSMLRARPATVAGPVTIPSVPEAPVTVAGVPDVIPEHVPEIGVEAVPASTVPPVPKQRARTVARPVTSATARRKPDPARVFATELAEGRAPSLRAVKERMHCGTDRAREIRQHLADMLPEAA